MLSLQWLTSARAVMDDIQATQLPAIQRAAELMADSIAAERWVHTFGCGHATIPVEEMYPRIGGFVGFHPIVELPLTFFTRITGEMGIHQFLFLERAEGYGQAIMKGYTFDNRDTMWIFSHTGINNVNIDIALRAKKLGMRVVATGSANEVGVSRHASGRTLFEIADVVIDTRVPAGDSLVRRVLAVEDYTGADLLAPTRLYVEDVRRLRTTAHAFAHVTGGGIAGNLARVLPEGLRAEIDWGAWERPPVFAWLARHVAEDELRRVFNLGIGYLAVMRDADDDLVIGRIIAE